RDYLEDFSDYYVRCFKDYKRKCKRLHFFNFNFSPEDFDRLLLKQDTFLDVSKLQIGYLGFIVFKPIPETFIGRTCIQTYQEKNGREYLIKKTYPVNFFGIELTIDSLAYQEQDLNVAACATTALWSAFHKTGELFHHQILSPVSITKSATEFFPNANRNFPNEGLAEEEMSSAIRNVNLEPLFIGNLYSDEFSYLNSNTKGAIYSYVKYGIPIILGVRLYKKSKDGFKFMGKHAVTIAGINIDEKSIIDSKSTFILKSEKINKIYVHDDRIGPFAMMEFDKKEVYLLDKAKELESLSITWPYNEPEDVRAIPEILLMPLYHKIRVPYNTIADIIFQFNNIINDLTKLGRCNFPQFEWDIFLSNIKEIKNHVFTNTSLEPKYRKDILTKNYPRFIWRAIALVDNKPLIEFLFDATDIIQGDLFLGTIDYDKNLSRAFKELYSVFDYTKLKNRRNFVIFKWFKENH
ncbi:MAG: hypothetical protein K9J13_01475, partial [Saprospiraceae bacterium]|nr:hypothetical protein [Saprospiraceae bacterium]